MSKTFCEGHMSVLVLTVPLFHGLDMLVGAEALLLAYCALYWRLMSVISLTRLPT